MTLSKKWFCSVFEKIHIFFSGPREGPGASPQKTPGISLSDPLLVLVKFTGFLSLSPVRPGFRTSHQDPEWTLPRPPALTEVPAQPAAPLLRGQF